ncbi:hypothetical protein ACFFRR_000890 [Megaselia abdita]
MTSMSQENLESFINDYLKEDLKELENHLNLRNQEIMEFLQLKNTIAVIQSDLNNGFKAQMNVGNNMFMEAKVEDPKTILVLIGKGIYMDFTLEEALTFINFKIRVLEKEAEVLREESIKKKADIKLGLLCLLEKTKLY